MIEDLIFGRKPAEEAIEKSMAKKVYLLKNNKGNVAKFQDLAREKKLPVQLVDKAFLDDLAGGKNHQGVVCQIKPYNYSSYEEILAYTRKRGEDPFLVLLDGVEDPQNLGAIIRTAYLAGAHGVLIPKRRSAKVTATVFKTSAGACAHIKIAQVTNVNQTIEKLKKENIWVYGADMGGQAYYKQNTKGPICLVLGSEGKGLSDPTKSHLDGILSIPMYGNLDSLNVSVSAGILAFDIARQRHEEG